MSEPTYRQEFMRRRVHFNYAPTDSRTRFRFIDTKRSHSTEVIHWLNVNAGPEGNGWKWFDMRSTHSNQEYDGFFVFEDQNVAMMFKVMFR